jgi:hypothetical protein
MSVRKRAFLTISLCVINVFGTGLILHWVAPHWVWLVVAWPAAAGTYLLNLRCPRCGTPIYKRHVKFYGMDFTYWGGIAIPKTCGKCRAVLP